MYLNTFFELLEQKSVRLTLTWDVFKWNILNFISIKYTWLTLTWDVFKY